MQAAFQIECSPDNPRDHTMLKSQAYTVRSTARQDHIRFKNQRNETVAWPAG